VKEPGAAESAPGPTAEPPPSLAASAGLLLGTQVVGNAGYFAAVLLLARALGPTARGQTAFITVTAMVAARCAGIGLNEATRVFAAQRPRQRPVLLANLVVATAALGVGAAAIVCGALLAVPGLRPPGIGALQVGIVGLATLATGMVFPGYAFLQGASRFRTYGAVQAAASWFYALLLGVAWAGPGLTATRAASLWVVFQTVHGGVLLNACRRSFGVAWPDLRLLRQSVRFGLRAWAGGLSQFLNARTDQILTALLASEATLGIYAVAVNTSEVLFYLPNAVAAALLPAVASRAPGAMSQRTLSVFRAVALVTVAASLAAAALGPLLIPLLFGHAYRGSVAPFLWLLPSALGFAANVTFSGALVASGAPGRSSLGATVALVLGVALDVVLIPSHGAVGAAAAASAALLAGGLAAAAAYRAHVGFRWVELIPRARDVATLRLLARRARSTWTAAPS
jgi:O-antigen/teichoic acid export membrane protein